MRFGVLPAEKVLSNVLVPGPVIRTIPVRSRLIYGAIIAHFLDNFVSPQKHSQCVLYALEIVPVFEVLHANEPRDQTQSLKM